MHFTSKHKLISFYIATILLSGIFLLIQIFIFLNIDLTLMQLAPAFAVLIITGLNTGKTGILSFIKRLIPGKINIIWILFSVCIPVIFIIISDILYRIVTNQGFDNYGHSAVVWNMWSVLAVLTGSIGEEIGWRSYLLPLISKKYSFLLSSIIVGAMWGFWHFQFGEGIGFLLFIITIIELSVIMTWLYYKGNESLITAIVFHSFFNYSWRYFYGASSNITLRIIQILVLIIPVILIVLKSSIYRKKMR